MNNPDRERLLDAEIRGLVRRRVSPGEPSVEFAGRVLAATRDHVPWFSRLRLSWLGLSWRAVWTTAALAAAIGTVFYLRPVRREVPPEVITLSKWHSPTESLLRSPAPGVPRLGEAYFQVKRY